MASDDISRLYTFMAGTTIVSTQANQEFNQLVTSMNTKAGRGVDNTFTATNIFSGATTISGAATLSHVTSLLTDTISEYTSATGVTIDGVLCKDNAIRVPGSAGYTPTTNGDIGYDSTSNSYDVMINGVARALATTDVAAQPGFKTGRYYSGPSTGLINTAATGGFGISSTNTVAIPFYVPATTTFDRMSVHVTGAVGASTIQLGIYNNANGIPTTRVLDAGTVSGASTGIKEATISQSLAPGWYWLALRASSASLALISNSGGTVGAALLGVASDLTTSLHGAIYDSATMPSTWTYTSTNYIAANSSNVPIIFLRAA